MSNTLDELIALRMRVEASCAQCVRFRPLDLRALASRYGGGERLDQIVARLVCSKCSRRGQGVLLRPPGTY